MKQNVSYIFFTVFLVILIGCPTYDDLLRTKKLESISVDVSHARTSFVKGGTFSSDGIILKGYYSDGTTKTEPLVLAEFSGFDSSTVSDAVLITVTYENCTVQYPVAILDAVLNDIDIQVKPLKTIYYKGEKLDLTGLVVMGIYSNGASTDVTKDCSVTGFDPNASGTQLIYVSHPALNGVTKTFPILISESALENIRIINNKNTYVVDSQFDYSHLTVIAVYGDGKEIKLSPSQYTVSGFDSSKQIANQEITVTVNNLTASFTIKIAGAEWAGIAVPEITGVMSKPLGTVIDFITVVKKYSDETVHKDEIISRDLYTIEPSELKVSGLQTVTVTYNHPENSEQLLPSYFESETSFQVYVTTAQLKEIKLETAAGFSGYVSGTDPSLKDFIVTGIFSDNTQIPLTNYCTVVYYPVPAADAAEAVVKASYYDSSLGKKFDATVSVPIKKPEIIGIAIAQPPSKFQYIAGDKFDISGLKLKRLYSNGTSDELAITEKNCTFDPPLTTMLTASVTAVKVTHNGYDVFVPVAVTDARLQSIILAYKGAKPSYPLGTGPSAADFKVTGTYSDTKTKDIPATYCVFTYVNAVSAAGMTSVKAAYYDPMQQQTFTSAPIEVIIEDANVQSISVLSYPSKLSYAAGETFDPSGLRIQRLFSNKDTDIKTTGDTELGYTPSVSTKLTTDIKEVSVTCSDHTIKIPITVTAKKIKSVLLAYASDFSDATPPSYPLGTGPYAKNFTVMGTYTDGGTQDITQYCILSYETKPAAGAVSAEVKAVYYDSLSNSAIESNSLPVTVKPAEVTGISVNSYPLKLTYIEGEQFEPNGLEIKRVLSDGTNDIVKYPLSDEWQYEPGLNSLLAVANKKITVTVSGKSVDIPIMVEAVRLQSICLAYNSDSPPSYPLGTGPDASNFIVTGTYTNGKLDNLTDFSVSYVTLPGVPNTSAQVVAIYTDNDKTFTSNSIEVIIQLPEVESIHIINSPVKTTYIENETFDSNGLVIIKKYIGGSIAAAQDNEFNFFPTDMTSGTTQVVVTYTDKTTVNTVIPVTVLTVQNISLNSSGVKTNYFKGDTFNPTGLVITKSLSNGTSQDITVTEGDPTVGDTLAYTFSDGFEMLNNSFPFNKNGNITVTVTCYGKTASFPVSVQSGNP